MKHPRQWAFRALPIALATVLLAACAGGLEEYEVTNINEQQFPVDTNASAACIRAAKRATSFCIGRAKNMTDANAYADCNDARWDYHRYCN